MLTIRLRRTGTHNRPAYRVVVTEARSKRDGRCLEEVGYYNPRTSPTTLKVDLSRVDHWVAQGAKPSETVRSLIRKLKKAGAAPAAVAAPRTETAEAAETV